MGGTRGSTVVRLKPQVPQNILLFVARAPQLGQKLTCHIFSLFLNLCQQSYFTNKNERKDKKVYLRVSTPSER
jgi:hypothetical protein